MNESESDCQTQCPKYRQGSICQTDPTDYEEVPVSGACIIVKTTKETDEKAYRYYYWQWREGNSIALVNPNQ